DRQQAQERHFLLAYRLSRRHQGAQQRRDPRRPAPRARHRKGRRADGATGAARPAGDEKPQGFCRTGAQARRAAAAAARYRGAEPQEFEGVTMADDNQPNNPRPAAQTFQGLGSLRQALQQARPAAAAPPVPAALPEDLTPQLDAQGRAYATG